MSNLTQKSLVACYKLNSIHMGMTNTNANPYMEAKESMHILTGPRHRYTNLNKTQDNIAFQPLPT